VDRKKRIVFISHCILNQNAVVKPLARANGAYTDIIKELMKEGIGIHQLPCPEFRYLGLQRKPMSKNEYDTAEYRKLCTSISEDTLKILKEYLDNDYDIVGIIGINQSPTCSIRETMGILMEELLSLADKQGISLKTLDIPTDYVDGKDNSNFILKLRKFIME